jgi:hypothetical protein
VGEESLGESVHIEVKGEKMVAGVQNGTEMNSGGKRDEGPDGRNGLDADEQKMKVDVMTGGKGQ